MASPSSASVGLASASRRVQVNVSSPSPAAAFYASSQASPRARERVRVSTPSATTTSASSMSSQASPQARRNRVSNPSAATAPELVVAQGLHDTLIQRLTEDLQRAAFLVSVGVTPKKARARKALRPLRLEDGPASPLFRQHRLRHPPRLSRRPILLALHFPPGGHIRIRTSASSSRSA